MGLSLVSLIFSTFTAEYTRYEKTARFCFDDEPTRHMIKIKKKKKIERKLKKLNKKKICICR